MAQVTGTYIVHDAKGLREDLSDIIYSISPTDTPFMSGIGKKKQLLYYMSGKLIA